MIKLVWTSETIVDCLACRDEKTVTSDETTRGQRRCDECGCRMFQKQRPPVIKKLLAR